ncbi:MAG: GNAT family N-acetyltransferase [Phycisphaerae bacterium]|nr:GNAT family N-acetyltransferase [Gemmatimonadaceae bacterium]
MNDIEFAVRPTISDDALNDLFALAWPAHERRTFTRVLSRSLSFVVAFHAQQVVGFVNVAWDGGSHAFILDPTVHPHYQRRGIGSALVHHAVTAATENGVEWVHVDFEPHLSAFYSALGFRRTDAGVLRLRTPQ